MTAVAKKAHAKGQAHDFRKAGHGCPPTRWHLAQNVFLVGFMGAGKTSVARKLAHNAGLVSVDMDTYIERRLGMKIKRIFEESGEEGFRLIETDVLAELASGSPRIVSCGGGVVLSPRNRQILKEQGYVVYLQVSAAEAASRISDLSSRPLFGDLNRAQRINEDRFPLYREVADAIVDTAGRGSGSVSREVFGLLKRVGILVRE